MKNTEVKSKLVDRYTVLNETRALSWYADEPIDAGGENKGPKPTELLLSALASCKLITLQMYAERKDWDYQGAEISLKFAGKNEDSSMTIIEKSIKFKGNLDEKQKQRLIDISGRCPVAKMLSGCCTFINI